MKRLLLIASAPLALATPLAAQDMGSMPGMNMPGMHHPPAHSAAPHARARPARHPGAAAHRARPARRAHAAPARHSPGHAGQAAMPGMRMPAAPPHDHGAAHSAGTPAPGHEAMDNMPGMATPQGGHQGHDMGAMPGMAPATPPAAGTMQAMPGMESGTHAAPEPAGTDLPAATAPPPPAPADHAADVRFPPAAMAAARRQFAFEHGGGMTRTYSALLNIAEYQARRGRDGFRWDGEAWYGSDVSRLFVKSEGEGSFGRGVDAAEVQALYSRAIDPYWNLQAGLRYDFRPNPSRVYATLSLEGLAPGFFETSAALFLSNKGDLLARAEAWTDERITQRLVLQPRVELNFAAQDVPENGIGSGLSDAEAGLRLRYEIRRELAPYVGISWTRRFGDTGRYSRAAGEGTGGWSAVFGIRTWF